MLRYACLFGPTAPKFAWSNQPSPLGSSQHTCFLDRLRRACPSSERTSDGYIELTISPHFSLKRQRRFQGKWGPVADGGLVATTCISEPGQGERTAYETLVFV